MSESAWIVPDKLFLNGETVYARHGNTTIRLGTPGPPLIQGAMLGIMIGVLGTVIGMEIAEPQNFAEELSDAERAAWIISEPTRPGTFTVTVVADIASVCPPTALACTYTGERPCHVYLPQMPILYLPKEKVAFWEDFENGKTVAHEFLHCMRGSWHPR